MPVASDVAPEDIESFISVAAKTHGIDPTVSFPFEVRGNIGPYVMHVNAAPTKGEHGMGLPILAVTVQDKGDRLDGASWQASMRRSISWGLRLTAVSARTRIGRRSTGQRPRTSTAGD